MRDCVGDGVLSAENKLISNSKRQRGFLTKTSVTPRLPRHQLARSLTWPVDDIFVLLGVITSLCLDTVSARMGVEHLLGPTAWNSLSDDLRDPMLSTDSFRRLLKTRLFSQY